MLLLVCCVRDGSLTAVEEKCVKAVGAAEWLAELSKSGPQRYEAPSRRTRLALEDHLWSQPLFDDDDDDRSENEREVEE